MVMNRFRGIFKIVMAAVLLLCIVPVTPASAQGNNTLVENLELYPAFQHISVYSSFSGDDNGNSQAVLEYRQAGSSTWIEGTELYRDIQEMMYLFPDSDVLSPNPYFDQWRAVLFGLQPDTQYEIRVTYTDPDGVSGTNPVTADITTRDDDPPSNGTTYYVSTSGSDSNNGLTTGTAFATIQHAADIVQPGDTVRIMPGTYNEMITVTRSGAPDNFITFQSHDLGNAAIIDAQATLRNNFKIPDETAYIRIKGLDLRNPEVGENDGSNVFILEGSHDIIVEDCYLREPGGGWRSAGVSVAGEGAQAIDYPNPYNITVQRCVIQRLTGTGGEPCGVNLYETNGGNVVRGNHIEGEYKDGFSGGYNAGTIRGATAPNTFIYENEFIGNDSFWDDAVEIEGSGINCAVWGNYITNSGRFIFGIASVGIGPLYIIGNYNGENNGAIFKAGTASIEASANSSAGRLYVYHNTIYHDHGGQLVYGRQWFTNQHFLNNIFAVSSQVVGGVDEDVTDIFWDYNLFYCFSDYGSPVQWQHEGYGPRFDSEGRSYDTWRTTWGQQLHGLFRMQYAHSSHPEYATPDWIGLASTDPDDSDYLYLLSTSPALDAGVIIPGINDANSPWAYSGTAPDMGAFEGDSGPPVDDTPPYTSGHGPADGAVAVARNTNITVHVEDDGVGVDESSIAMTVEGATVTPSITGTTADYTLTYDPPSDFDYGQVIDITIDAQDLDSPPNVMTQDAYSFTITSEFNNIPELSPIGDQEVAEGASLVFTISATDDDGPLPLAYSAENLPAGASFDEGTQEFSWTPSYTQSGDHPGIHFEVTDGQDIDWEDITITVTNTNREPQADAGPDQLVVLPETVTLDGSGSSDPDGDTLDYLWNQSSGPSVTLSDETAEMPTFSPPQVGTYVFSLVVNDGTVDSDPDSVTIAVIQWPYLPVRVNCAGSDYTDVSSNLWEADQAYSSGTWGFYGDDNTVDRGTGRAISNTDDDRIYQTERYGLDGYRFDLGDGAYDVGLHFAETYHSDPGDRIFDVYIEGQLVLDDLDIYSEVGSNAALIKAFSNVAVTDGQLNIDFTASVDKPEINGIEIFNAGTAPNNPPVLDPIGDKTVEEGQLLQFTISASDPNNNPLTYSASDLPTGAGFDTGTHTFSWTPESGQAGTYTGIHFEVSDGDLTDSEDITITVAEPSPFVGGGGGGGGGPDTSPPRFSDITVSDISKTSATISWATHEKSSSQVEYWASPHQFSPLDETLVRSHVVQLTDLNPATTYNYTVESRDATGNLAVSSGHTFTTPGTPATFAVSSIEINPTEVNTGETVIVSIKVTNSGDAAGDYEIVLKINDAVVATKDVTDLLGGATQEVIFNAARDTAGYYTVEVNGATGSFTVTDASVTEAILFEVTPAYNAETGQFARARITYEVESPGEPMADVRLVLKVGLGGEPVEELSLFTANQLEMGRGGSLDYIPPQGWADGTYTFQAELYANGELYASTAIADLEVSANTAVAVVRWATLGSIIGIMLIVIVATVVMMLRRRRDMLGA